MKWGIVRHTSEMLMILNLLHFINTYSESKSRIVQEDNK